MRILMLSQFFYPPAVGGEERLVTDLSHELAARGHYVSVVTLWRKGFPEFEVQGGLRIYRVRGTMQKMRFLFGDSDCTYSPPFPDPEVMHMFYHIIQKERPEIIHAHNWFLHSFTPLKAWSKAKLVVSLHDYSLVCVQKRLMRREVGCTGPGAMKCLACGTHAYGLAKGPLATLANFYWGQRERQAADMFLPVSQVTVEGNQLDKYNMPYRIIPNFVPDHMDSSDDDNNPLLAQLPQDDFLLFVGDVSHDKGAEVLFEAYAEMKTHVPLVLIGRQFLSNLSQRLPRNVFWMGPWPHDAVMAAWKRCMIGLVPSIVAETFGIVALEAMYMGKPVIAARSGGLTDVVVHGQTGLLVAPGDPQALRVAIQALLEDPARREHMGTLAKQRARQFQAKAVISRFEQVYQELLEADLTSTHVLVKTGSK